MRMTHKGDALERAGGLPHRRIRNGISPVHQTVRCPEPSARAPFGRAGCAKIPNFPAGATIRRSGKSLLVIRRKTVYDPVLGRGKDAQREHLGRVVDGVFYTREEYRRTFRKSGGQRDLHLSPPDSNRWSTIT